MDDVRSSAYRILLQTAKRPVHPDRLLRVVMGRSPSMSDRDRALLSELVYGVLRWQFRLDWHIDLLVRGKKVDPEVRILLRMGLYQILFLTRIPPHAAVNETVNVAKAGFRKHLVGFVNGVLREAVRRGENWPWPDPGNDPVEFLAVRTSHPMWFAEYALKRWGMEDARRILEANNRPAGLHLRVNTLRTDVQTVCRWFESRNIPMENSRFLDNALRVPALRTDLGSLEPFRAGWVQVQDEASQLVSLAVAPVSGWRVLDLCAGFGGKATHLAILMGDQGEVVAVDNAAWKLEGLEENARRQGLSSIRTRCANALTLDPEEIGVFDAVLVDAPCTGYGVLRRNPDIKWRRTIKSPYRASKTQSAFLRHAARFVRRGGILVYATCTVFEVENEGVADSFSAEHPDWVQEPVASVLPPSCRGMAQGPYLSTWPHRDGIDGFFIARWRRR